MQDGRRKLLKEQHEEIRRRYGSENTSYQILADEYGVSKRLIIFIVRPDIYEMHRLRNKRNQQWKRYYDTNKRRQYMRVYRSKKRALGFTGKEKKGGGNV